MRRARRRTRRRVSRRQSAQRTNGRACSKFVSDGKEVYRSTAPGPGVVPVSDDECRGMGTHFRLERELARVFVLAQPDGVDERVGQLFDGGRVAERFGERGWRGDWSLRLGRQLGETGLVVGEEDGAVLEERAVGSPLSAASELSPVDRELTGARLVEAWSEIGNRRAAGRRKGSRVDADRVEGVEQQPVDPDVRGVQVARVAHRPGDAVGDLTVVENGAAARWPADDVERSLVNTATVVSTRGALIPAQRERR